MWIRLAEEGKGEHKKEKNNRNKKLTERVDSADKLKKLVMRGQREKVKLEELRKKTMKNKR